MNDRIRLLWAQCVIKHTKDPMNWQNVADEFAELLIKETLQIARVGMEFGPSMDEAVYTYFGIQ